MKFKTKTANINRAANDFNLAREANAIQAINTISDLYNQGIEANALENNDLFEFSQNIQETSNPNVIYWQSKAVSWGTIKSKILENVDGEIDTYYQLSKNQSFNQTSIGTIRIDGVNVTTKQNEASLFIKKIAEIVNGNNTESSAGFKWKWEDLWDSSNKPNTKNPMAKIGAGAYQMANNIWRDMLSVSIYLAWLDKKTDYLEGKIFNANDIAENAAHLFSNDDSLMIYKKFYTWQNESTAAASSSDKVKDNNATVNSIRNDLHEGFMMQIPTGTYISSEFMCDINGNLVCYGWLDSSTLVNVKMLPTAWCAIEAQLKGTGDASWEILNVQPVVPNKFITYVSFIIPVKKGLKVRIRTGFPVGGASGRYSSTDVMNSLSNHVPNAFLGAIYGSQFLQ